MEIELNLGCREPHMHVPLMGGNKDEGVIVLFFFLHNLIISENLGIINFY